MRTFTIIWLGQIVSTIGSYMTVFALTIWVWEITGSATALALVSFFSQLPRIFVTLFAGIIVDRFNRKHLMILGDSVALFCTTTIGLLYLTNNLQVWHLYFAVAVYGSFAQIQQLAYSTSITMIVPKQHYTRAGSMGAAVSYGSAILSPALAGSLYGIIGLGGIILIDITTFAAAIGALLFVQIPQPPRTDTVNFKTQTIWQNFTFGFRYILAKPSLLAMVIAFSLFAFPNDLGKALYNPLILARTDGSATVLGSVTTAAGIGGVTGAVILSTWGGFQRRIHGMLVGFIGAGLFRTVFGLGQSPLIWIGTQFCAALNTPLFYSSSNAIWYAKVSPDFQGRVLAADQMIGLVIGAAASLVAGPLADYVFEPAMRPGGHLAAIFGPVFGTNSGAGIALLYVITSIWMLLVGVCGYAFRTLRDVEDLLPDHDVAAR